MNPTKISIILVEAAAILYSLYLIFCITAHVWHSGGVSSPDRCCPQDEWVVGCLSLFAYLSFGSMYVLEKFIGVRKNK